MNRRKFLQALAAIGVAPVAAAVFPGLDFGVSESIPIPHAHIEMEFAQAFARWIDEAGFDIPSEVLPERKDIAELPEKYYLGDDKWSSVAFPKGRVNEQT